jgi:hypothetical protein
VFAPTQTRAVQQQGQMIENISSQNPAFLVNEQKATFEGSPQKE